MGFFRNWFGYPGQRNDVFHAASTSEDIEEVDEKTGTKVSVEHEENVSFNGFKLTKFDKALDWMVYIVGTQFAFIFMWIIVALWVILGGVLGFTETWQVIMQDGQSIQTYIWDTFLMRQQLIQSYDQSLVWSDFRSRNATFRRLFTSILSNTTERPTIDYDEITEKNIGNGEGAWKLPEENWFDKLSTFLSLVLGSAPSIIIYWMGIIAWVACGVIWEDAGNTPPFTGERTGSNPKYSQWSNMWQLWINTATAIVLLVTSVSLQNVRARHDEYLHVILEDVLRLDKEIEVKLRKLADNDKIPNPVILIPAHKRTRVIRCIDFYGDIVGTGVGLIIAIFVIGVWLMIGHPMSWNTNWWLIIGTYTGLIGFLDGFVVRNVYYRTVKGDEKIHEISKEEDKELFEELGIPFPEPPAQPPKTIVEKVSIVVNDACSSTWGVGFGVFTILLLIIIASAMKWSQTGQLICNTPTMIIEGFFLLILIQAHNWADENLRTEVADVSLRRRLLHAYVSRL